MPPSPPPPFSIMRLIIGPMVCISMAKRRLPIFAFIISSIGAIWVIMSSPPAPPPPPKPANCAFAGVLAIGKQQQHGGRLADHLVRTSHGLLLACVAPPGERSQPDARRHGYGRRGQGSVQKDHAATAGNARCIAATASLVCPWT